MQFDAGLELDIGKIELFQIFLGCSSLQLGMECPIAVECQILELFLQLLLFEEFSKTGHQVDNLDLGCNAHHEFCFQLPNYVISHFATNNS